MSLNAVYEDAGAIPESVKEFYAEQDGKYVLQVEGMTPNESIQGLTSALEKERNARKELEKNLKSYGDVDVQKYQEYVKRVPELEKALEARNADQKDIINAAVEERLGPLAREKDQQISSLRAELENVLKAKQQAERNLHDRVFDEELDRLARANGVRDEAIRDVRFRARDFGWKLDESMKLAATGRDGSEIYSRLNPSQRISIDEWFKDILPREAPHFLKDSGGSGAGNGGGAARGLLSRKGMTPADKAKYIAEHGLEKFQQLPE